MYLTLGQVRILYIDAPPEQVSVKHLNRKRHHVASFKCALLGISKRIETLVNFHVTKQGN